jgi:hypothetical protein
MDNHNKSIWIGGIVLACLVVGLGVYYFFFYQPAKEPVPVGKPAIKEPLLPPAEKPAKEEEKEVSQLPPVELNQSDDLVRQQAKDLSSHPKWAIWLKIKGLIQRLTAAVDNIAQGLSPRAHLNFLAPQKSFTVLKKGGKLYVDPRSYQRYNIVADVIHSLDAEASVRIYKLLKPLFQKAYQELGYPNQDFQEALIQAMVELLRTPVVKGEILLEEEEGVVTYQMADYSLENLSEAQKHLLRMGPENVRKIQGKLREMARVLGVPENRLPKPREYTTGPKGS